jgi:hypothetical protein
MNATSIRTVGPYCPWPREVWDDTCIHPPGSANIVAELRNEHRRRHGPMTYPHIQTEGSFSIFDNSKNQTETKGPCSAACDTRYLRGPKELNNA